jgi:hypothetical protein
LLLGYLGSNISRQKEDLECYGQLNDPEAYRKYISLKKKTDNSLSSDTW